MLNYKPLLSPDGELKPVFNPNDFEKQYASVSYADLLDYANLYSSNNFHGENTFVNIFVDSINSITEQTLNYISNLTSDAQTQIDGKRSKDDNLFNGNIYTVIDDVTLKMSTESYVDTSVLDMKNSLLNGASPAYDTLIELPSISLFKKFLI